MRPLKRKISISLDEDVILKMQELAEKDICSLSQYINLLLRKYIDEYSPINYSNHKGDRNVN